jgi:hypothetical protein
MAPPSWFDMMSSPQELMQGPLLVQQPLPPGDQLFLRRGRHLLIGPSWKSAETELEQAAQQSSFTLESVSLAPFKQSRI